MKPVQLILIGVASVAALGAGFMIMNLNNQPAPVAGQPVAAQPQIKLKKVLIARETIPMGSALGDARIAWQDWPADSVSEGYILQETTPEAQKDFAPTIARATFFPGEPIREAKIVRSDSGYLSAILPAGKRAMAVRVKADTSAGGFILPNDRVDLISNYTKDKAQVTETVLKNIRILAIDQLIEEKEGQKAQVGQTATLELTEAQVEVVTEAKSLAGNNLILVLRSIEDAQEKNGKTRKRGRGKVKVIRYGKATEIKAGN
jgi:pilus assembly protein CpaB